MDWRARIALMTAALWWGSLTAVGAWVVPLLFTNLPTPALAGQMAGRLFAAQTWVALGCGLVLMMLARASAQVDEEGRESSPMAWAHGALAWVAAGLLVALVGEFGVAPRILARENLKLWHAVGSALYALQWVCAGGVLWKLAGKTPAADRA